MLMVAFASAYVFFATQMYTTDTLVRADPPDLNELGVSPLDRQSLPPTPSLSNEIAVMQSRSVAEPVIQRRVSTDRLLRRITRMGSRESGQCATAARQCNGWRAYC